MPLKKRGNSNAPDATRDPVQSREEEEVSSSQQHHDTADTAAASSCGTTQQLSSSSTATSKQQPPSKRPRSSPTDDDTQSIESNKKCKVSTLRISASAASKWKPLSTDATQLLCDSMEACIEPSVTDLTGAQRSQAEEGLQSVLNRVKDKLLSAKAPSTQRLTDYSTVKTQLGLLVDECVSVVKRNEELESKLEDQVKKRVRGSEAAKDPQQPLERDSVEKIACFYRSSHITSTSI